TIVLQHPLYWYSTPPLLKQWEDLVLEHGWAYGSEGTALRGKRAASAVSAGGREEAYRPKGRNRYSIREFLRPVEATWRLCGVLPLSPFLVHGTHRLSADDIDREAARYRAWIEDLIRGGGDPIP
ncbi:MAG: NAD(P)H-dependent oxidoreductase, partial [Gemmatimonadota bacterium]